MLKKERSVMIMKCCNLEHFFSLYFYIRQSCIHSNLLRIHFSMTSFITKNVPKPVSTHSIQMLIPITSSFTEQFKKIVEKEFRMRAHAVRQARKTERKTVIKTSNDRKKRWNWRRKLFKLVENMTLI